MKAWVSSSVLCSCLLPWSPLFAWELKFEDIPTLIRKNSKSLKVSESTVEVGTLQIVPRDRAYLPRIDFESGLRHEQELDSSSDTAPFWKVNIESNLYRGGRDEQHRTLTERQQELKTLDAQIVFRNEVLTARQDFIRLIAKQDLLQLTKSILQQAGKKRRAIQRKVEAGLLTESSIALAASFGMDLEQELISTEQERDELRDHLILTLGLEPHAEFTLPTHANVTGISSKPEEDVLQLSELKKLTLQSDLLRSEANINAEWWRPNVDVFASFGRTSAGRAGILPTQEASIGLKLTLNLQDSAELRAVKATKFKEANIWVLQKERVQRELQHRLHENKRKIETYSKIEKSLRRQSRDSERLEKTLQEEFERGIRDSSDLIDTLRASYEVNRKLLEASTEVSLARAELDTFQDN